MKKKINILIILTTIVTTLLLSNALDFNYTKYSFILSKYKFNCLYTFIIIAISCSRYKAKLDIDYHYIFKLYILLSVIWSFIFFYYRLFFFSLLTLLFQFIIYIILFNKLVRILKDKKVLYINMIWLLYILFVNIKLL